MRAISFSPYLVPRLKIEGARAHTLDSGQRYSLNSPMGNVLTGLPAVVVGASHEPAALKRRHYSQPEPDQATSSGIETLFRLPR
jgi:hypothetical protein